MGNEKQLLGKFISDTWWIVLQRGMALTLFGVLFSLHPSITLFTVIVILGAYWFVDGIFMIITSIVGHRHIKGWVWGIFSGILGVLAGIAVILHPVAGAVFTQIFLVYFMGFTAIFKGISDIVFGFKLRQEIKNEWVYILAGIISILFGIIILTNPVFGNSLLTWIVVIFAIFGGILLIIRSFQLNKIATELVDKTEN